MSNLIFRTGSLITIWLPLAHTNCLPCTYKIVPEFLLIPYDMDDNHINRFTDVEPASKAVYSWGHFILNF